MDEIYDMIWYACMCVAVAMADVVVVGMAWQMGIYTVSSLNGNGSPLAFSRQQCIHLTNVRDNI